MFLCDPDKDKLLSQRQAETAKHQGESLNHLEGYHRDVQLNVLCSMES